MQLLAPHHALTPFPHGPHGKCPSPTWCPRRRSRAVLKPTLAGDPVREACSQCKPLLNMNGSWSIYLRCKVFRRIFQHGELEAITGDA